MRGSGTGPESTNAPIFLTLRHKASGTTLWSYEVNHDGTHIAAPDVEQAIGAGISEVARSGGVVIQHQRKLLGGDMSPGYPCLIAYDSFRQSRNPAERPAVSKCLEASAKLYPNESLVLQAQSFLELSRPHGKSLVPLTPTPRVATWLKQHCATTVRRRWRRLRWRGRPGRGAIVRARSPFRGARSRPIRSSPTPWVWQAAS